MGHLLRFLSCLALSLAGAVAAAAFEGPTQTAGGAAKAGAEKDKKTSKTTAQRRLDGGVKAYEAGKFDQAIRAFSAALRAGGLDNQQLAKALYYRGLAYRRKQKPGLAISDLTGAAWLKNGLSAAERQDALSNRTAAYREAGIAGVPQLSQTVTVSEAPASWQTATDGGALSSTVAAAPPPPPSAPPASSGGGIGGFFNSITGGLFGGSSSSSNGSTAAPVTTTASVGENATGAAAGWAQTTTQAGSPQPSSQSWATTTPAPRQPQPTRAPAPPQQPAQPAKPAAAPAPFATQVAAVPEATAKPPKAKPAQAKGKYHVQVAAVRTRDEAYALSVRLVSQHGGELGGRRPAVDETVIGSMGTFYRVRLGPYQSAKEPKQLCGSLRATGFDCLVITQ